MQLNISKTGTKADVVEQIQAETTTTPLLHVETAVRKALAQHLQEFARDDVPVSVTASISLNYAVDLDTDGKEIPAHKVHAHHAKAATETAVAVKSEEDEDDGTPL
jgi:hypothetical protein